VGSFAGLYAFKTLFGITNANHPNGIGGIYLAVVLAVGVILGAMSIGVFSVPALACSIVALARNRRSLPAPATSPDNVNVQTTTSTRRSSPASDTSQPPARMGSRVRFLRGSRRAPPS